MCFKYFPPHICAIVLMILCILPDPGHTQPQLPANLDVNSASGSRVFADAIFPASRLHAGSRQDFGSRIFTFSDSRHEQAGLVSESSVTAGMGRHILGGENFRLDVDLGVGK